MSRPKTFTTDYGIEHHERRASAALWLVKMIVAVVVGLFVYGSLP